MKRILFTIFVILICVYGLLWVFSFKQYEVEFGVSYSPQYARYLGLDHDEVYSAMLNDLKPSTIRLAAPWSMVEPGSGTYDFSEIDEMLLKARKADTKVVLTIGQKVPRWPECYIPAWAESLSEEERKEKLLEYVRTTILRYKDDSSVEYWQIENEPFIRFPFGECKYFELDFIKDEIALVRELDPARPVIITDSGELSTFRRASWMGDILGTTVYRTTRSFGGIILHYDWLPAAFYKLRAKLWGNNQEHFFVSELQAEPWFKDGALIDEESFSVRRFDQNVEYAQKVGASRAYLWGVEWWYYMKTKAGDGKYWEKAKEVL